MLVSSRTTNTLLVLVLAVGVAIVAMLATGVRGGPLDPPDAPASSMKTLQQVEPRTPISSVPYIITAPGSYYLTQNVTMSTFAHGIVIQTSSVVLDLNGFTIDGANVGSRGVYVQGDNVTIRNGTVSNFTDSGIDAQTGAILENVHADHNEYGIIARGTIRGCTATDNTLVGVYARYSDVEGCHVSSNPTGFLLVASTLSNCSAAANVTGIQIWESSLVQGCNVRGGTTGISVGGSSKETGGSMVRNNTVQYTGGNGIHVTGWDSYVEGNTVTNAGASQPGSGIAVTGQRNRIDSNHVNDASFYGIIVDVGTGNLVVRNWSDANAVDYFFSNNNDNAPIQQAGSATSPWANLTH